MYLGRSVRLNSWDVRHPRSLVTKVARRTCASPAPSGNALGFTLLHALFLGIMYLASGRSSPGWSRGQAR